MKVIKHPTSSFIKLTMELKNISVLELSNKSNIPTRTLSLMLDNKIPFTKEMDKKLHKILGYNKGILFNIEKIWYNRK